jgi:two-component system, NarL family, response regulator DegU
MDLTNALTKREYDVLSLIAKGMLNKEISLQLEITENTVEQHLKTIYKKLGVRNRTEALIQFLKVRESVIAS